MNFRLFFFFSFLLFGLSKAEMPKLILPTENTAVLKSRPNDFFMYVNRYFEGKDSQPWEAGTYGFVRNMKRTDEGVIGTRFHEGADIKPVRRDAKGVPLDPVVSVASGVVAYINPKSNGSNYGKYVAVRHDWGEGPIVSLYAHLNRISCEVGQEVQAGDQLGILGYTGAGIDKKRAHLHFEIALMLSEDFEGWHQFYLKSASGHGNYNGLNLSGMNGVEMIRMQMQGKIKSVRDFLRSQKPYFAITVPSNRVKTLAQRYPWLWTGEQGSHPAAEISFTASGLPVFVRPSKRFVTDLTLTGLEPFLGRHEDRTIKRLSGSGRKAELTSSGKRYLALLLGDFRVSK